MSEAGWSDAALDDGVRSLTPSGWGLGRRILPMALLASAGLAMILLPQDARHPAQHFKGAAFAALAGILAVLLLFRVVTGRLDLVLTRDGLMVGKIHYDWSMMASSFAAGTGRQKNIVTGNAAGKAIQLVNVYGMPTPAFVALLNSYLPQTSRPAGGDTQRPDHISAAPAGLARKTLPAWAWVMIITTFFFVLVNIRFLAMFSWALFAPADFASHSLDDQALGDRAGHDASFLPVLMKRAEAGDRSAMYFYGDLFDPGDFICETTVQKNPATALLWYNRAVALDDQGAERNLGVMYHTGDGVVRDDAKAAQLFERAVAKNDDFGDYYLGVMLETGAGEPQNLPRAVALEQASAAQGQALGQVELGRMYFSGIGVPVDHAKAQAQWRLAAAQGDRGAQSLLSANGMQ